MSEPNTAPTPASFADLPILPTGSGVADLEVAYEKMKLAEETDGAAESTTAGIVTEAAAYDPAMTPTEDGPNTAESAAHPS